MNGAAALPSKRLRRLEAAMAARDIHPVEKACLRAERAGHLAQQGHFAAAQAEINGIHADFDRRPNPAVSVWLNLAEGFVAFFSSLSAVARDKMKRAHALSGASQLTQLQALSAAWLAHTDYVALDPDAMAAHLRQALALASANNHPARGRACLTLATALNFAGRGDEAQAWFARAREHATADGDEVTQISVISNIAWHHGAQALHASVFGGDVQAQARHAMAGAISIDSFDQWAGTTSLDNWAPMLRAVALSTQDEPAQALALYEAHFSGAKDQGMGRLSANFLADMAWCRWRIGDSEGARKEVQAALSSLGVSSFADDLAVAHGRLAQVLRALGDAEAALDHDMKARECRADHQRVQARMAALIADWPSP